MKPAMVVNFYHSSFAQQTACMYRNYGYVTIGDRLLLQFDSYEIQVCQNIQCLPVYHHPVPPTYCMLKPSFSLQEGICCHNPEVKSVTFLEGIQCGLLT
jgi:hypothetical protein